MKLFLYTPTFFSESGAVLQHTTPRPKGNTRYHAKALFKSNKVEHNISYNYNPSKNPTPITPLVVKALAQEIASKLELLCNMKKAFSLTMSAGNEYRFSFVAFGFDEVTVLKTVELFDKPMMAHGWDQLQISIIKLDGSVERVDFVIKNTARYSGMSYDLNTKLM